MSKTIKQLIEIFAVTVEVAFKKKYEEYSPKLHALVGSYKIGFAAASKAIFTHFLQGLQKVNSGPIPSQTMPDNYFITIPNDRYGEKVEVQEADFERANGDVANLELYTRQIEGLAIDAKNHPVVMALNMIEAGASTKYGVCFDGKTLFAEDHEYAEAKNQSNLLDGSGVTKDAILTDLKAAYSALGAFKYPAGGRYRKFNDAIKAVVICSPELRGIFEDIRVADLIGSATNTLKGLFEIVDEPLMTPGTWYLVDTENNGQPLCRPILNPIEKSPELKDNIGSESQELDAVYKWQTDYRGGYAYGAWWKIVAVAN